MGRRMRPLDPTGGPLERFACELRTLRSLAGDLPFWKMALRCQVSKSALAAAVAGYQLPSERVVREFVRACGGDWAIWRERWLQVAAELDSTAGDDPAAEAPGSYALVLAKPRALLNFGGSGKLRPWPPEEGQVLPYLDPPAKSPRYRSGFRPRTRAVAAVAAAFFAGCALGYSSAHQPGSRAVPVAQPLHANLIKDGEDPYVRGCGKDQVPVERQPIYQVDGTIFGWVVLYVSSQCSAAWGYVFGPNSPHWTVNIRALRVSDSVQTDFSFRGVARPNSWGNALSTQPGCVRAEAWIDNGSHAMTGCWKPDGPVVKRAGVNGA